jgi:hypothetical protein
MVAAINWSNGGQSFWDFIQGLESLGNAQNSQEAANEATGVVPPQPDVPPDIPFPPRTIPINDLKPCEQGYLGRDGMRYYSNDECMALKGNWNYKGECTKPDGGSWTWDCRGNPDQKAQPSIACSYGVYDADSGLVKYTNDECYRLNGTWTEDGTCLNPNGTPANYSRSCGTYQKSKTGQGKKRVYNRKRN